MFAILDLAIGLVFVFLLFSLVVSAANEILLTFFNRRAELLQDGLKELLHDRGNLAKACDFFAHPLIAALSRGADGKPTYVPRDTFVSAVLDLIAPARADKPRGIDEVKNGIQRLLPLPADLSAVTNAMNALVPARGAAATFAGKPEHKKALTDLNTALSDLGATPDPALAADVQECDDLLAHWQSLSADAVLQSRLQALLAKLQAIAPSKAAAIQALLANVATPANDPDFEEHLKALLGALKAAREADLAAFHQGHREAEQRINGFITQLLAALAADKSQVSLGWFQRLLLLFRPNLRTKLQARPLSDPTLEALRAALRLLLAKTGLRSTLVAMLDDAQHDYEQFRVRVGTWFDNSMDRVTGWYKKETQTSLFWLGLILAIACNVDAVHIMRDLSRDPAKLGKVVEAAQKMQQSQAPTAPATTDALAATALGEIQLGIKEFKGALGKFTDLSLPIGWDDAQRGYFLTRLDAETRANEAEERARAKRARAGKDTPKPSLSSDPAAKTYREKIKGLTPTNLLTLALIEEAEALDAKATAIRAQSAALLDPKKMEEATASRTKEQQEAKTARNEAMAGRDVLTWLGDKLIFWKSDDGTGLFTQFKEGLLPHGEDGHDYRIDKSHFLSAIFGCFLAALAASLGAPFWFDSLNRIMTIRSAGKAPEEKDTGEPTKKVQNTRNNSPQRPNGEGEVQR